MNQFLSSLRTYDSPDTARFLGDPSPRRLNQDLLDARRFFGRSVDARARSAPYIGPKNNPSATINAVGEIIAFSCLLHIGEGATTKGSYPVLPPHPQVAGVTAPDPNSTMGYLSVFSRNYGTGSQDAANSQQQSTAIDLLQKIGDYEYASGDTSAQALAHFGVNTAMIASLLGESVNDVGKQVDQEAAQAGSLLSLVTINQETNDILTDLLAQAQGKPLPVDLSTYGAPFVSRNAPSGGGSGSTRTISSSPDVVAAIHTAMARHTDRVIAAIQENTQMAKTAHTSNRAAATASRGTRQTAYVPGV